MNQFQSATRDPLKEFVLFRDPTEPDVKPTEDDVLRQLGFKDAGAEEARL